MHAIMQQPQYGRSLRTSLLQRVMDWLGELVGRFIRGFGSLPHARALAIGIAILAVVLVIARILYAARVREQARTVPERAGRGQRGLDPWTEAERAAAEGRFTDAAHALYASVLQTLARRERLRLHDAKTNGDYTRELRASGSPVHSHFRDFGRLYDHIIYGLGSCDEAGYLALRQAAAPMLEWARAA